jgi:hypothetical protein
VSRFGVFISRSDTGEGSIARLRELAKSQTLIAKAIPTTNASAQMADGFGFETLADDEQ